MSPRQLWEELFHGEASSRSSAILRLGLVGLCWTRFATELMPYKHVHEPEWLLLGTVFYLASICLFVGLWSQASAAVLGLTLLSFRYYLGFHGGYEPFVHHHVHVLAMGVLFLAATPCGRSLSLDRWHAMRRGAAPPERGPILGLRLITVMIGVVYLFGTESKLTLAYMSGERTQHSLQYLFVGSDPVTNPAWPALTFALAWFSILVEPAIAVGLWVPRLRLPAVLLGVFFHLMIFWLFPVGTFSLTMCLLYLAAFPPEQVHRFLDRLAPAGALPEDSELRG